MSNEISENITELTQDLVEFRTVKGNEGEFRKAFNYIEVYLSGTGLKIRRHEFEGFTTMMVLSDPDPEILLHGHIDVVSAEDEMLKPEVRDEKIFGRGAGDMKAGVALLMELMKNKVAENNLSVGLMIVSDEELGGFNGAKKIVDEELYSPEFVMSAEPNNTDNYLEIVTEQKGVVRAVISAEGKKAHGSQPWKGENAAEKLWEKYIQLKPEFESGKDNWSTTVNLGAFQSGEAFNVVPNKAEAKLDIRWTDDYTPEDITSDAEEIDGLELEILSIDPMLKTDPENQYIKILQEASKTVLERKIETTQKEAASDMRHFSGKGIPGIVFGPEAYGIHEDGEYALIDSFEEYYRILENFLNKIQEN